jgi:nitronate monooxygenase
MIASEASPTARGWWPRWRWAPTASTWARGSCAPAESAIHQNVKEAIVAGSELDTELIFRPLRNTARVASNSVSREVVEILNNGGQFEERERHRRGLARREGPTEIGDLDAAICRSAPRWDWSTTVPTCDELDPETVAAAEDLIHERLADLVDAAAEETCA